MMERATRNRESYRFLLSSTDVCNYGNGVFEKSSYSFFLGNIGDSIDLLFFRFGPHE
jgi:hypothetical protein